MTAVLLFVVGAVVAGGLWVAMRPVFDQGLFLRTNYRGAAVPVGVGVLLALAAIAVEAVRSLRDAVDVTSRLPDGGWFATSASSSSPTYLFDGGAGRVPVLMSAVGFALLGLFDDLAGTNDEKGFRGHLRAMVAGRLTTGGTKLVLGGLLAIVVVAPADLTAAGRIPFDAALVALAANLGNLFDRAPGRTTKVGLLAAIPVLIAAGAVGEPVAVVVGAAAGLLAFDLREQLMLGDAGANALGAVLGLGVVLGVGFGWRIAVLVLLLALNLLSEKVSYSTVIERTPPLRWLDHLGRRPEPGP